MKIAIIGPLEQSIRSDASGGTELWTYNYATFLFQQGHDVTLFCNSNSDFIGKKEIICNQDDFKDFNYLYYWYIHIKEITKVIELQDTFDIIHVSMFSYNVFLGFAKFIHKPTCITVHSAFNSNQIFSQLYFDNPNIVVVCISENQKNQIICKNPLKMIYNGIMLPNQTKNNDNRNYFFWIGRICYEKGLHDAITAIEDKKLIIAGPIFDNDYFQKQVKPYLSEKIQYVGILNGTQKEEYFKNALATLMPVHWEEPFGLVSIESLSFGTPVICYKKGALPEIVKHNYNGFVVEENNICELKNAINNIKKINSNNCRLSVQNFSIQNMCNEYLRLYKDLIKNEV